MDNVECPFCGTWFDPSRGHPKMHIGQCPLEGYIFSAEQWNKRPLKKEQPAISDAETEIMHLRRTVGTLISILGKK